MDLENSIRLPIGTQLPQNTVLASPIIQLHADNVEVQSETDGGWPTIITMELGGNSAGVAVDYLGAWRGHEVGIEEIDLLLTYEDDEWLWRAIVAFSTKNEAIDQGQYESDDYNGYELVPWDNDNRFEHMEELIKDGVTPIAYSERSSVRPAHAMQEAENFHTLSRIFGFGHLSTLAKRRSRLFTRVVPKEVRWEDEDTSLQKLAQNILNDDQDISQPADNPYEVGDVVKLHLDPSSRYHRKTGVILDVMEDKMIEESENNIESYSYRIKIDEGELDTWFRHGELLPAGE